MTEYKELVILAETVAALPENAKELLYKRFSRGSHTFIKLCKFPNSVTEDVLHRPEKSLTENLL